MTAASRSLATALWGARFASGLLLGSYTTNRDTTKRSGSSASVRRTEILSREPAGRNRPQNARRDDQGALGLEQAHQQLKEVLGLDHFEGRSWRGLHRHALMTMIAYAFLC
jgi:SRSO17 transposase